MVGGLLGASGESLGVVPSSAMMMTLNAVSGVDAEVLYVCLSSPGMDLWGGTGVGRLPPLPHYTCIVPRRPIKHILGPEDIIY